MPLRASVTTPILQVLLRMGLRHADCEEGSPYMKTTEDNISYIGVREAGLDRARNGAVIQTKTWAHLIGHSRAGPKALYGEDVYLGQLDKRFHCELSVSNISNSWRNECFSSDMWDRSRCCWKIPLQDRGKK